MIVKKVKNPRKASSKASRVRGLAEYIMHPETREAEAKCTYSGARGFLTDDPGSQQSEMLALALEEADGAGEAFTYREPGRLPAAPACPPLA